MHNTLPYSSKTNLCIYIYIFSNGFKMAAKKYNFALRKRNVTKIIEKPFSKEIFNEFLLELGDCEYVYIAGIKL